MVLWATSTVATIPAASAREPPGVGLGLASVPLYPGSAERELRPFPVLDMRFGRWFIAALPESTSPIGLGVDLLHRPSARLGIGLSSDLRELRRSGDADRIAGLGDIEATQRAHLYGVWTGGRFLYSAAIDTDIGGHDLGTRASMSLLWRLQPAPRWQLAVGPGLYWSNRESQMTIYGIDDIQSARSGLAPYRPGGGLAAVRLVASVAWRPAKRWTFGTRLSLDRLDRDLANSPIVERRLQSTIVLMATYRF